MKTKSEEVAADVAALLRARNPLLWVCTREEARAEKYLVQAAAASAFVPRFWDCGRGFTELDGKPSGLGDNNSNSIDEALNVIRRRSEEQSDRGVWIMRDLHKWLVDPVGIVTNRQVANLCRDLPGAPTKGAQALIVVSPVSDIPPELSNHATVIEWPIPDREEVGSALDALIRDLPEYENKIDPDTKRTVVDAGTGLPIPDKSKPLRSTVAPNGIRDAAIDAAIGLTGTEAQACFSKSIIQLRKIDPVLVAKEKKRVVTRDKVLEWFDPLPGGLAAVGGLENLKEWLLSRAMAYSPKAREYGLPAPKGCFLFGVSGCGKTLIAKAIATAFGVPLLKLDLGALKGKFVGESEANLRKALRTIEALGRCVVLTDEVEKALAGATQGGADAGVSSDQLGALLQWMNDRPGGSEAFIIATANDIEAITTSAPEFIRKGRFDELFFIDLPNRVERLQVLEAALKSHGRSVKDLKAEAIADVVDATDTFTGAEIAALVPDAMFKAFADDGRQITCDDLIAVARSVTPLAQTAAEKIKRLREWSRGKARPATRAEEVVDQKLRAVAGGRQLDL